jgi:hypothetical protein
MFKTNRVVQVTKDVCLENNLRRTLFKKEVKKAYYNQYDDGRAMTKFKKSKVYSIVLEQSEFSVNIYNLPKCNREKLDSLIHNELVYSNSNNKNVIYSYKTLATSKRNMKLAVFYLNFKNPMLIDTIFQRKLSIRGLYLLQFCILNYIKKKIKSPDYIVMFVYNSVLYCLCCKDQIIINNSFLNDINDISRCEEFMSDFIKQTTIYNNFNVDVIYGLNFQGLTPENIEFLGSNFIDLGTIDEYSFIRSIIRSRG